VATSKNCGRDGYVAGFNLGVLMRALHGQGTPERLQARVASIFVLQTDALLVFGLIAVIDAKPAALAATRRQGVHRLPLVSRPGVAQGGHPLEPELGRAEVIRRPRSCPALAPRHPPPARLGLAQEKARGRNPQSGIVAPERVEQHRLRRVNSPFNGLKRRPRQPRAS
jgi:hypothetical protein